MILLGINPKTFKFKCLSPIYDDLVPVFNNSKTQLESSDEAFDFYKEIKARNKEQKDIAAIWKQFIHFNNTELQPEKFKDIANYDQLYDYLSSLLFKKDNIEFSQT